MDNKSKKKVIILGVIGLLIIVFIATKSSKKVDDKQSSTQNSIVKNVDIANIYQQYHTPLTGRVVKEGVITMYSRVNGVVQKVYVTDGQEIKRGQRITYISDGYTYGNKASVGYQIASQNVKNNNEIYDKQISIIDEKRDSVNKTGDSASEIAKKQYTIQKRNLESAKEIMQLQQKDAAITASLYRPSAPFSGIVDYVFVSQGDHVSVGSKIATINTANQPVSVTVSVSSSLASMIDVNKPSVLTFKDKDISLLPTHLTQDAVQNQSYLLTFTIPKEYHSLCEHDAYIKVSVPLDIQKNQQDKKAFVPIDAVRLMSDKTVLFIEKDGIAHAKEVQRGEVIGSFMSLYGDFENDEKIILNRNVFDGDHVHVKHN